MNIITLLDSKHSPIYIPPFDGLCSFEIEYKHKLKKPTPKILKIELTVVLHLEEKVGNKNFIIMNILRSYRINIVDKLTALDVAKVWHESAIELVRIFNIFEEKQFGEKHEILVSSEYELQKKVIEVVSWFYGNNLKN